jgi:hypothetical protein
MLLKKGLDEREKADALISELGALKACRRRFEPEWDAAQERASNVILPFNSGEYEGDKAYRTPKRISDIPAHYLEYLVTGVCGYSISPNIDWLRLGLADKKLEDGYGVRDWLEECENVMYAEFNRSNLYGQMPKVIESAVTFGHGVMLADEDVVNGRINFTAMNPAEIYIDTNEYDEYETVFREFYMEKEDAASYFGLDAMDEKIKSGWGDAGGAAAAREPLKILHAVYRRKNPDGRTPSNREMEFASIFLDIVNKHIIKESGYRDFPYSVFIWKKINGKKYGTSPAVNAKNSIWKYFKLEEAVLKEAQTASDPPLMVPDELRGHDLDEMHPGGRSYYDVMKFGDIKPVQLGMNFPITLEVMKNELNSIKELFHVDFFLILDRQTRQITATEVMQLQGEKAAMLSNMVNNLNAALAKIVQRSFDILVKQRKIPEPPGAVKRGGAGMKAEFISILARAQRKAAEWEGIEAGMRMAGAVADLGRLSPEMMEGLDYIDVSEMVKRGFRSFGVNEKVIREDEDVAAMRGGRAAAAAEAEARRAAAAREETVLKNYKNLNEPVTPGSPMAQAEEIYGG